MRWTLALALVPLTLWPASSSATPTQPGELVNALFDPTNCEFCHFFPNATAQSADPPYSPHGTWQGTMMANSARDPVFWAGVAVADQDAPGETELCVRCHAPMAWLEGNGAATTIDQLSADEQSGVSCEVCHRMMEDPRVPPGNAMYTIDDVLVDTNVPRRGPWDFTDGNPEPPHTWINDPYTGTSRLCGTCHDVTTSLERVDDAGVGLGVNFNEQRTYSEWLGSDFAVPGNDFHSCADCHMPAVDDVPGCAQNVNQFSHAEGGRRHDLVGANRFMVQLLRQEYGSAGANLIPDLVFDIALDRMDELLGTAATLDVVPPDDVDLADGLQGLEVTVTNNTGHKLPTGYSEGRVMWLEVLAEYGGEVVYSSGAYDVDDGIEADPQLRTYEAIGEDYADGTIFHLLLNNHWVVDSRIPPLGLQPNIETDPVGNRYTLLGDGTWPNFDEITYDFPAASGVEDATPEDTRDDALVVTIRLNYLINTPEYIAFLGDEGATAGADVAMLFDTAGGAPPMTLAEQTLSIPIIGFAGGGTTTTGGSSDGPADTSTSADTTNSASNTGTGTGTGTTATTQPTTADDTTGDDDSSTGGSGAADGGDGGCGCSSSGSAAPFLLFLLPLLARRRRPSVGAYLP